MCQAGAVLLPLGKVTWSVASVRLEDDSLEFIGVNYARVVPLSKLIPNTNKI